MGTSDFPCSLDLSICSKRQARACATRSSLLRKYADEYDAMVPMVLLLKRHVRKAGVGDGGLLSLSLSIMVATYLIHLTCKGRVNDLLQSFLRYHAELDYASTIICMKRGYSHRERDADAIFIQDPAVAPKLANLAAAKHLLSPFKDEFGAMLSAFPWAEHGIPENFSFWSTPIDLTNSELAECLF